MILRKVKEKNKNSIVVAVGCYAQVAKEVAMQVAAMNPIAVTRDDVPQETKDGELKVAIEKTQEEQVKKAVEVALKKAGIN